MQAALRGSVARPCLFKRPWCGATDARRLTTHDGTKIDLLAVAPKTVGFWVDQASLLWPVSSARWNTSKGTLFWEAIRPVLVAGKLEGWSLWHRNVLVKLVSRGICSKERLSRLRGEAQFSIAATSALLCRPTGTCTSRRSCGRRRGPLSHNAGNSFYMGIYPSPATILPIGSLKDPCPVLWHREPLDGLLEGQGRGAPRRAGWAVVAVDDVENFKAAAHGAVPCDVLPGQTS